MVQNTIGEGKTLAAVMPAAFRALAGRAVLDTLAEVRVSDGQIDVDALALRRPSSTWTYLVNDDPFRNQIGMLLTGLGGKTVAIYAAVVMMPLLLVWGLVDRWLRKRPARRRTGW